MTAMSSYSSSRRRRRMAFVYDTICGLFAFLHAEWLCVKFGAKTAGVSERSGPYDSEQFIKDMEARLEDITRGLTDEHREAVRQTILLRMKKEGRKLGRKEGMAKGLEKGIEKGRAKERVERVLAMHAKAVSPEQIAYLLNIPISTVKEILSATDGDPVNGSR